MFVQVVRGHVQARAGARGMNGGSASWRRAPPDGSVPPQGSRRTATLSRSPASSPPTRPGATATAPSRTRGGRRSRRRSPATSRSSTARTSGSTSPATQRGLRGRATISSTGPPDHGGHLGTEGPHLPRGGLHDLAGPSGIGGAAAHDLNEARAVRVADDVGHDVLAVVDRDVSGEPLRDVRPPRILLRTVAAAPGGVGGLEPCDRDEAAVGDPAVVPSHPGRPVRGRPPTVPLPRAPARRATLPRITWTNTGTSLCGRPLETRPKIFGGEQPAAAPG